jgi:hypothetical protein
MDWMSVQWITTYWMPLLIAVVIGFILGWLFTGLSPRRKNAEYEAQLPTCKARAVAPSATCQMPRSRPTRSRAMSVAPPAPPTTCASS